jgi:hypothetical protein
MWAFCVKFEVNVKKWGRGLRQMKHICGYLKQRQSWLLTKSWWRQHNLQSDDINYTPLVQWLYCWHQPFIKEIIIGRRSLRYPSITHLQKVYDALSLINRKLLPTFNVFISWSKQVHIIFWHITGMWQISTIAFLII